MLLAEKVLAVFLMSSAFIQSPMAKDSLYCKSTLWFKHWGQVSPGGTFESSVCHVSGVESADTMVRSFIFLTASTLGNGLCLPGHDLAPHSRTASLPLGGHPSKLQLASHHHSNCGSWLRTEKPPQKDTTYPMFLIFLRWLYWGSLVTLDLCYSWDYLWFSSSHQVNLKWGIFTSI